MLFVERGKPDVAALFVEWGKPDVAALFVEWGMRGGEGENQTIAHSYFNSATPNN
ncbi:hypothetical protein [Okeania sp. KiyG1]|uniref:hypothetical protein n=1 Tax=Okeania sp. KiyG1 TaxID=2720165 RepID=UPI001923ED8E|nr:hypothetical protein [Okeania sp. KiyG1]